MTGSNQAQDGQKDHCDHDDGSEAQRTCRADDVLGVSAFGKVSRGADSGVAARSHEPQCAQSDRNRAGFHGRDSGRGRTSLPASPICEATRSCRRSWRSNGSPASPRSPVFWVASIMRPKTCAASARCGITPCTACPRDAAATRWIFDSTSLLHEDGRQQGVKVGYSRKGLKPCLKPLLAVLEEAKLVAQFWLRSGNAPCASNVVSFTLELLSNLPRSPAAASGDDLAAERGAGCRCGRGALLRRALEHESASSDIASRKMTSFAGECLTDRDLAR